MPRVECLQNHLLHNNGVDCDNVYLSYKMTVIMLMVIYDKNLIIMMKTTMMIENDNNDNVEWLKGYTSVCTYVHSMTYFIKRVT